MILLLAGGLNSLQNLLFIYFNTQNSKWNKQVRASGMNQIYAFFFNTWGSVPVEVWETF